MINWLKPWQRLYTHLLLRRTLFCPLIGWQYEHKGTLWVNFNFMILLHDIWEKFTSETGKFYKEISAIGSLKDSNKYFAKVSMILKL